MTDKEKAIIMAYTGVTMLMGDKFNIFHKYVESILDKPVFTHELGLLADEIKEKSEADFMALCADENPNDWIPCSKRPPKEDGLYLVTMNCGYNRFIVDTLYFVSDLSSVDVDAFAYDKRPGWYEYNNEYGPNEVKGVIAWMPRPEPYKGD